MHNSPNTTENIATKKVSKTISKTGVEFWIWKKCINRQTPSKLSQILRKHSKVIVWKRSK